MSKEASWRARWSEKLGKGGMTPIANVFLERYSDLGITSQEAMFIIHCFKYKWTVDYCYPSFETIAKEMGKDRNTIQGHARALEEKGFLIRIFITGSPSKLNFSQLINILEVIGPHRNLDREGIKNIIKVYRNSDGKKEALIKSF